MSNRTLPAAPTVPLELWRQLYQAAADLQLLAPWRWMDDTHVLGINSSRGVRLVSVMGCMGEVFGLASYRRSTGANFLIRLLQGEFSPETSDGVYYQDALLVDFVPAKELRKADRLIVEQIGFPPVATKPRRFPKFISYDPGYLPWFLDETEAHQLLEDLQKTVQFARLVQGYPKLFEARKRDQFPFFPEQADGPLTIDQLQWHVLAPVALPADAPAVLSTADSALLNKTPRASGAVWELTAFYSRDSISEPPRPYWPKLALSVDAHSGMVLGFQLGTPRETMAEVAVDCLKKAIGATGLRPATIKLDSANLLLALAPVAEALEVKLLRVKSLPMVEEARQSLEAHNRAL